MSTPSKRQTVTFGSGPDAEFGDDDPTVIDGTPLVEFDTPDTMPRCIECGRVVFFDAFTPAASFVAQGVFQGDRCVRSRPEVTRWWYWCGEKHVGKFYIPPR